MNLLLLLLKNNCTFFFIFIIFFLLLIRSMSIALIARKIFDELIRGNSSYGEPFLLLSLADSLSSLNKG